jgi:uncharacterized protein YndB with AHSA1/START domain
MSVERTVEGDRAVFRVHINGSRQAVWDEMTRTDGPQPAIFHNVMHTSAGVAPGSAIQMRSKNGRYVGMVGEILEVDPPRLFRHTLRFTHLDDPETVVTYELEEKDGGTEFTLTVDRLVADNKTGKAMVGGGSMICSVLKSVIENGNAPLVNRVLFGVLGTLAPVMTPRKCKAEHWPIEAGADPARAGGAA